MNPTRFALAALGFTCVAAAAGGGYLATRQNGAVQPATAATIATTAPVADAAKAAVPETEAIVGDVKPADVAPPRTASERPAAPRASSSRPAPPRRAEPSSSRAASQPASAWPVSVPSGFPTETAAPQPPQTPNDPSAANVSDPTTVDAARAPEPPKLPEKEFEELVVTANSVIGLQLDGMITSDRASVEDRVEARVVRDVRVGSEVAIPAGARALGSVTLVERGGKFKDRARLGIRFHTLVLADGTRLPITSETIYRNGDAPGNASAAKIGGGAVAGAILGAIVGGAKGAAIGAGAGAGGGTAAVMAGDPKSATFPTGTEVTARILSPVTVTVER